MKVAYFSPSFPPFLGGMGTACYYTANEIGTSHQVTVFLPVRHNSIKFIQGKGGHEGKKIEYKKGNYKIKLLKPWFSFSYADFIPQVMWKVKDFDVIHLYYPYFGIAEFLVLSKIINKFFVKFGFFRGKSGFQSVSGKTWTGPKLIFHHQMDFVGQGLTKFIGWIYKKTILTWLMKIVDMIFVLSEDYVKHSDLKNIYKKYPDKFRTVPNAVDVKKFRIMNYELRIKKLKNKFNARNDDKVIFTAQALDKAHFFKGIDILIKSFKLLITSYQPALSFCPEIKAEGSKIEGLPIAKLIIAGDGNLRKYYENLVRQLNIQDKVIFLGNVDHSELPFYYNLATVTVVPSTQKTESFSITAVESMACGTPVIVSDLPGLRTTIENNKTGLLVKPNNENDLAEKILFFLNHPEKVKEFGENGKRRVEEKFDWKVICQKMVKYYELLLAKETNLA